METLVTLLGGHLCIVNIQLGPSTVLYREVLLYDVVCVVFGVVFIVFGWF